MTNTTEPKRRLRTCVGCGAQSDKIEFFRVVRLSDGSVEFDASGRKAGRGAYICSAQCLSAALKNRKLQKALKTGIDEQEARRIVEGMAAAATGEGTR